jgi:hypothetical protein
MYPFLLNITDVSFFMLCCRSPNLATFSRNLSYLLTKSSYPYNNIFSPCLIFSILVGAIILSLTCRSLLLHMLLAQDFFHISENSPSVRREFFFEITLQSSVASWFWAMQSTTLYFPKI